MKDRRGDGRDPLVGLTSEDEITGAAPRVLAHPGVDALDEIRIGRVQALAQSGRPNFPCVTVEVWPEDLVRPGIEDMIVMMAKQALTEAAVSRVPHDSAVWEPQAGSLETGLPASHPGRVSHQAASRIAEAPYPLGPLASRRA